MFEKIKDLTEIERLRLSSEEIKFQEELDLIFDIIYNNNELIIINNIKH